jgi:phage protein D
MVKKPSYRLTASGEDITAILAKNLISLTYTDKQGSEVDDMSLTLHGLYEKKPFGTDIALELGQDNKLYSCGSFAIQSISKNYTQKTTTVSATAVNFASAQKVKKSRSWERTNLYEVARQIAEENGMGLEATQRAQQTEISSVAQDNIEDFAFLNLLCIERGYIISFFNKKILIQEKDAAAAVNIEAEAVAATTHKIKVEELISLTINEQNRDVYDAVMASWMDTDIGDMRSIKVGKGEIQVDNITIPKPKSDAEAIEMANARLLELTSSGIDGSFTSSGAEIKTGELIEIEGIEGVFSVTNVMHTLNSSGYTINVTFKG